MKNLTETQILNVFNKFYPEMVERLEKAFNRVGYKETEDVDGEGLLEEMLCFMVDDKIMDDLVVSIEDSVGPETYGYVETE